PAPLHSLSLHDALPIFNVLKHAGVGHTAATPDAETSPLRDPTAYRYDFNLADITEVWRRGSVIASWLLDLTAAALTSDPTLDGLDRKSTRLNSSHVAIS